MCKKLDFIVMVQVVISVYINDSACVAGKKAFERSVYLSGGIEFDFKCVLRSLKILFGETAIVLFKIC